MASPAPFTGPERRQLLRFCLYGFLKNQQYYEPFFMLALLAKGLSFLDYGLLWGFCKVCTNVLEIPAGAIADVWGRRRIMIASFCFYIASFSALAFTSSFWALFPAMLLFAGGEAFREGTHKAMIFDWLTRLGRGGEKTRVYGITRSWSKLGSALCAVLAAVIVIGARDYKWVFMLSALPFALNIVNFVYYPKVLDGEGRTERRPGDVARMLWSGLRLALTRKALRSLLVESMCFEGIFEVAKDYLQPLLKAVAAIATVRLAGWLEQQGLISHVDSMVSTALLVAVVGLPRSLLESFAARQSHRASAASGGDDRLASRLWVVGLGLYLVTGVALLVPIGWIAILGFVAMTAVQNLWRPTLTARYYSHAETASAATTLSVEAQAKGLTAAVVAPLLGLVIDRLAASLGHTAKNAPVEALWPVAAAGVIFCVIGLAFHVYARRGPSPASEAG
jgi:MFS family permease